MLKILPEFYDAVESMEKPFEVRKNDRNYQVGDILILQEYVPEVDWPAHAPVFRGYTGASIRRKISYVLPGGQYGIDPEYVVLGLQEP